jgi:hypothetical protein
LVVILLVLHLLHSRTAGLQQSLHTLFDHPSYLTIFVVFIGCVLVLNATNMHRPPNMHRLPNRHWRRQFSPTGLLLDKEILDPKLAEVMVGDWSKLDEHGYNILDLLPAGAE